MAWSADSIQGVWFTPPTAMALDANQLWQSIFGASPDNFSRQPGKVPFAPSTASAQIDNYSVSLSVQPGRVDIILGPSATPFSPPEPMADVRAALDTIVGFMTKALESHSATRVAIVTNVSQLAESAEDAAARVAKLAGDLDVPAGVRDLMFQLNVQMRSTAADLVLNRLCRWNAGVQQMIDMQFLTEGGEQSNPRVIEERHIVALQIDLNSVPSPTQLETEVAQQIVRELAEEGLVLLSSGYERFRQHAG